jgi:hypothetical protein
MSNLPLSMHASHGCVALKQHGKVQLLLSKTGSDKMDFFYNDGLHAGGVTVTPDPHPVYKACNNYGLILLVLPVKII